MTLENQIALLERQLSQAKTEVTKKAISDKIGRLKSRLEDASSKGEARTKVAVARKKVKMLPLKKFKAYIKQLATKPQYKFLKSLSLGQISDDKKRVAKPVGWRFSGRENMKKPTKAEIRDGKKDGSVYYENRSIRSDVSRAVRLKTGGGVGEIKITKNEFQSREDEPNRVYHWYEGTIGDYIFYAQTDNSFKGGYGSDGINKGSVYKLSIRKVKEDGMHDSIAEYWNKWDYRTKNTKDGEIRSKVVKYLDSISDERNGTPKKYKTGGNTSSESDYLGLVFSTDAQYEKAKNFYENESIFYADDFSDEFRALYFKVEVGDTMDTLEFELERELEESDLDGWYFTEEQFMAGGKTRENRPSPSISATSVKVGTTEYGNDGNLYESKADKNGVQRWVKVVETSKETKENKKAKYDYTEIQKYMWEFVYRKASDWDESDDKMTKEQIEKGADGLQNLPIHRLTADSPLDDFPASVKKEVNGDPFIAIVGKKSYYIDPQGYGYARYIADVTGFNNPKENKKESVPDYKVGDKFQFSDGSVRKITRIWDIKGVTYVETDKQTSETKESFDRQIKNGVYVKVTAETKSKKEDWDEENEQTDEIMRILDMVNNGKWGKGLKEAMRADFHRSGFTDFGGLIGNDESETSKNIQKNVMGFNTGKNTYLQANMIAQALHKDRGAFKEPLGEVQRLTELYLDGFESNNNATKRSAIIQLTEYADAYKNHPDQSELLFGKPYSFYTKEYSDAIEFLKAFGGDKFATGGGIKGASEHKKMKTGGNMNVENCERCNQPTGNVTTMSMFNTDVICMSCKEKEKQHPDYKKAVDTDNAEIKKGNYNFKGIGLDKNIPHAKTGGKMGWGHKRKK